MWALVEVAAALGCDISAESANLPISAVVTDTRKIVPGCLFIALKGPRFDGHEFVEHAKEQGAAAALVEREVDSALPQLVCADTRLGLGLVARAWRQRFILPLVAVTGNSGKTTVKEMTAALLNGWTCW